MENAGPHYGARTPHIDATLPGLFRRQVRATPCAVAVVCAGSAITYADLGRRVDQLAGQLRALGAGPGRTVAVAVPRDTELVALLLAVLQTGAAYLPLDGEHPPERIRYILEDARPHTVVTSGALSELVAAADPKMPVWSPDAPEPAGPDAGSSGPARPVWDPLPADTAYVIHTSGSTGRPKGVAVPHAAIVHHLAWMQRRYALAPDDRVLHKTPLGFDVSVWELFWPLTTGAVLVVAEPGVHKDAAALAELIRRERVSTVHFVPSVLDVFLDGAAPGDYPDLRRVLVSGEALPAGLCRRFLDTCGAALHNLYGPTEAAIDVSSWECPRPLAGEAVPIGRPVDNTVLHVLDEQLRPVPPGVIGQLYIAGIQLASGYVNKAALSAERFVACPFGPPGERMYATGDLAAWNADGQLEFRGRDDSQVKINGVRVEIAEVESALARHRAVRQAAVVVADGGTGTKHLAAAVTLDTGSAPGADRLLRLRELPAPSRPQIVDLAPGLPVCVHHGPEARFMYREIFDDEVYTREGVTLPDGACVLDVGANIGLFTLYAALHVPGARIFAFEPIPEVFEVLRQNVGLYDVDAVLLPYALADAPHDAARFTYYPGVSLISGRYADAADADAVADHIRGELAADDQDTAPGVGEAVADLVGDRLAARHITVPVRTVSQIIDEERIDRIDLLKIDVERSELDVLRGVDTRHWPRIDQVCLEVHDTGDRLAQVRDLLADRGFTTRCWTPPDGVRNLVNVYAVRPGRTAVAAAARPRARAARPRMVSLDALVEEIRTQAASVLPPAMLPATITPVTRLPLTPNGKLDRARLTADATQTPRGTPAKAPATERERTLCDLIAQAVGVPRVGVDDNIFHIGGTSLSAVKLTAAICRVFGVPFKLRMVVAAPTAAGLARRLDGMERDHLPAQA